MKRIQIIAATVALLSTATATAGSESNLRFDTVSIAPSRSTSRAYSGKVEAKLERPIQVILQNVTLLFCIQQAYSVKEYQILGPGWIKRARYDITATLPPGSAPDRVWPALQTLLAERFNVSIRRETRELPVYALAAAKQGPKLHPAVDGNRPVEVPTRKPRGRGSPIGSKRLRHAAVGQRFGTGILRRIVAHHDSPRSGQNRPAGIIRFRIAIWRSRAFDIQCPATATRSEAGAREGACRDADRR
jgi:uncharacterized protein (TIGR03435 family)